jgi:hypothetical protein
VLANFPAIPASQAADGQVQKLVGRIGLAGQNAFSYAPGSDKPCVYFETTVQEKKWRRVRRQDQDGNEYWDEEEYWETVAHTEQYMDFYVCDGATKIFVSARDRSKFKIQAAEEGSGGGWHGFWYNEVPPGIQTMIDNGSYSNFSWRGGGGREHGTGEYRFNERAFEWNELVVAFGQVSPEGKDPFTGQQIKSLVAYPPGVLDKAYFEEHKWTSHAQKAWQEFEKTPCVLLSDDVNQTGNIQTPPLQEQPPPVNWENNAFQFQDNWQSNYYA